MTLAIDLYWSFRSPYSYLLGPQLEAAQEEYDFKIAFRPVYPIAVRMPGFFKQVNPLWPPYLFRDTARVAEMHGIPYAWPQPDPVVMDIASGEVPEEQPYIHRLTRLGAAAAEAGKGFAFARAVSDVIFGGTKDWHEGEHLNLAVAKTGLDLAELDAAIEADVERYENIIAGNEADQKHAGHWGVPLMVFEGEPFFGQDRLELLLWRMRQKGLKARGS
jgi:2-hydroxychromene-2-carboxylate isomerase